MANWTCGAAWRGLIGLGIAALLAGCGLGDRARTLYFQQQRASTALIEAIDAAEVAGAEPGLAERLYDREDALAEACAPLREAGLRRFNDQEIDDELEWAVIGALDGCAATTAEVEAVLWAVDPQTARWYLRTPLPAPAEPVVRAARPRPELYEDRG